MDVPLCLFAYRYPITLHDPTVDPYHNAQTAKGSDKNAFFANSKKKRVLSYINQICIYNVP